METVITTSKSALLPNTGSNFLAATPIEVNGLNIFVSGLATDLAKTLLAKQAVATTQRLQPAFNQSPVNLSTFKDASGAPVVNPDLGSGRNSLFVNSLSGKPVFDYIRILPGDYFKQDIDPITGNLVNGEFIQWTTVLLSNSLVTATQEKQVVITDTVSGQSNSIKEWMNVSDWKIYITGNITSADNPFNYNEEAIDQLKKALNAPLPLEIYSYFLTNCLEITKLVVTSWSFQQIEGMSGVLQYNIEAVSDL